METKFTVKDYLKTSIVVHLALIAGLVFFLLITLFITAEGAFAPELHKIFIYLIPVFVLMAFLVSNFLYMQKITALRDATTLPDKLKGFRTLLVMRSAVLEAAGFMSVIAFMMTGEWLYAGLTLLVVLYMATFIPTKQKIITDLELNTQEEAFLNNPDGVIDELE